MSMIGSYVRVVAGNGVGGTALVAGLFVVSGGIAILGQLRGTAWCGGR